MPPPPITSSCRSFVRSLSVVHILLYTATANVSNNFRKALTSQVNLTHTHTHTHSQLYSRRKFIVRFGNNKWNVIIHKLFPFGEWKNADENFRQMNMNKRRCHRSTSPSSFSPFAINTIVFAHNFLGHGAAQPTHSHLIIMHAPNGTEYRFNVDYLYLLRL